MFGIKEILEKNGHEVIPFSIKNKRNLPNEYEKYFLSPVGEDNIYFHEYKKNDLRTVVKSMSRMYYSLEAKRKLASLIRNEKPDLIYILYYQNKISISIFDAAWKAGIPVVHRISDFGQICANGLFFRPIQKDICERCLHGSKVNAIKYKCVHRSLVLSAIKAGSLQFEKTVDIKKKTEAFIVPSKFTLKKLQEYGFPDDKLINIPTFFNSNLLDDKMQVSYSPFALYVGRIEAEKGILSLVKTFKNLPYKLKIIGFSNTNYVEELRNYMGDECRNIEFLGQMSFDDMKGYLSSCLFTVVPSECYDNFPNVILESYAFKKCVIASNNGSLKEIVLNRQTGLLFNLNDITAFKNLSKELFENVELAKHLGQNGYELLHEKYSPEHHYAKLITVFNSVVDKNKRKN